MEEEIDDKGGFVPNNSKVPDQSGELLILEKGKMARIYGSVKKTYFNIGSRVYPMMTRPRGLLLIINNSNFTPESGFTSRYGSEVDVRNLDNLFKYLGFRVFVKQNLIAVKMMQCIEKFKNQFEKVSVDMCIVCIMSHGNNGKLVDIDGKEMNVQKDIIQQFNDFAVLKGKPKLFLLQYCRGENIDLGVPVRSKRFFTLKKAEPIFLEDILIANSTVPGFASNRNTVQGSWFFQCLTKVFKENADHMDIREMFDEVANMLNDKESNDVERRKQTFEMVNRGFHKKLYFNPLIEESIKTRCNNEDNDTGGQAGFDDNSEINALNFKKEDNDRYEASSKQHRRISLEKRGNYGKQHFCYCNLF